MIPRYQTKEMLQIWNDQTRLSWWLEIEAQTSLACAAQGLVPDIHAKAIACRLKQIDIATLHAQALQVEDTVKHDVIAFLTVVESYLQEEAAFLHYGLTSSDVVDTALALMMKAALNQLIARLSQCLQALATKARKHVHTPMIGRSHGMHAEPTTFGVVLAGHYTELTRQQTHLAQALDTISVGKLSGAVGTFSHLPEPVEHQVLSFFGLNPEPVATQVIARDRHAFVLSTLALLGASIERLATNIRHWQRSELKEAEEPFTPGQKGSSAMPHKRNPIASENLCGMARLLRGYMVSAYENVALWHERDISHSSVERVILPDAFCVADYALQRLTRLIEGLVVYPEHMQQHLDQNHSLYLSQTILLACTRLFMPRQQAYAIVQRYAMQALQEQRDFLDLVLAAPELKSLNLDETQLRAQILVSKSTAERLLQRALI